MNLSELTEKIYAEGVEKGNQEAERIIDEANKKAADIIANAEKKATDIVVCAEKKAQELDAHTKAELKLYTGQSFNALKTAVVDIINGKVIKENVQAAAVDVKFMQSIIAKMAESMLKDGDVRIETKEAELLRKYFASNAKSVLDEGLKIEEVKGLKTDFAIVNEKDGYKLAFGNAEFETFFKAFLRPQLIELLFE